MMRLNNHWVKKWHQHHVVKTFLTNTDVRRIDLMKITSKTKIEMGGNDIALNVLYR